VATSPDYSPVCSPDTSVPSATSLDSLGPIPIGLGAATDLFCAAKAAEGASPRTVEWYQMILVRAVRQFGQSRPVDAIPAAELRAWLLELRASLAPESIAGYVRGLKAFGNWCAAASVPRDPQDGCFFASLPWWVPHATKRSPESEMPKSRWGRWDSRVRMSRPTSSRATLTSAGPTLREGAIGRDGLFAEALGPTDGGDNEMTAVATSPPPQARKLQSGGSSPYQLVNIHAFVRRPPKPSRTGAISEAFREFPCHVVIDGQHTAGLRAPRTDRQWRLGSSLRCSPARTPAAWARAERFRFRGRRRSPQTGMATTSRATTRRRER
jgi:hypothetical protein